jgi:hypothetical protein
MFDPALANCLKAADFVAIAADADALTFGQSMVTQTNSTLWSYDQIVKDSRYGRSIADALYSAIVASGSPAAAMLYVNYGIDLSLDATQAGLDQIAQEVSSLASTCNMLKLQGKWQVTVFASRGVTWSPTVNDISYHRAAIVAAEKWRHFAFDIVPGLLAAGVPWTAADGQASIAAAFAQVTTT